MDKIQYSCREGSVIYKTKMVKGPNRNFQVYDPLDFLAAVTAHIPDRREHLVRYYGWYSSVQRGKRRKLGLEAKPPEAPPLEDDTTEERQVFTEVRNVSLELNTPELGCSGDAVYQAEDGSLMEPFAGEIDTSEYCPPPIIVSRIDNIEI